MSRTFLPKLMAMILIPAAAATGWWFYWPTYHRNALLAEAEKEATAGNLARAEEVLRQLIRETPEQMRAHFLLAQVFRRQGRRQEAWGPLLRARELGLPEAEGLREYVLLEAEEDFHRAEGALRRVLQEHPEDEDVLQALANGYRRQGRWLDAEQTYTLALETQPTNSALLLERGKVRMEAGRFDSAAADFRQVLQGSSGGFQVRLLLAHCLLSDVRTDEAEEQLLICRRLLPARAEPLVGLASCAAERAELDKAQELVKEALALEPASPLALHLQGSLYLRRRRYDLAVGVFERLVRAFPRDKVAHLNLAQALSYGNEPERARKHALLYQQLDQEEQERSKPASFRQERTSP
jgi:predicted Zn-dependent protease